MTFKLKLPATKFNAGLHDNFHVRNLRLYNPNKIDFEWSAELPDMEQQQIQYEIDDILDHRTVHKRNEFLVSWKDHDPMLSAEYVTEAELRRDALEVLETYMSKHGIESDGFAPDEDSSDDEFDSDKAPADRSQPASKRRKTQKPAAATMRTITLEGTAQVKRHG